MKLSALAVLLFVSCAASQGGEAEREKGEASSQAAAPWRIEVTSSGGITGRGAGNYSIASDGKITLRSMTGKNCTFQATPAELARFEQLVANARPNAWSASYKPENSCCDRFEYELTLDRAGAQRKTDWVDDPAPMPRDLAAITEAITGGPGSLRVVYGEKCF